MSMDEGWGVWGMWGWMGMRVSGDVKDLCCSWANCWLLS